MKGFLDKLRSATGLLLGRTKALTLEQYLAQYANPNEVSTAQAYRKSSWVFRGVKGISDALMSVELRISSDPGNRGESIVESGPLYELLRRPCDRYPSAAAFLEKIVHDMMLNTGCRVLLIDTDGLLRPKELRPVPATQLRVDTAIDKWGFVNPIGYKFRAEGGGREVPYLPSEVIGIQFLDPYDPTRGMDAVTPATEAIRQDLAAGIWNSAVFANSAEAGTVLTAESGASPEQCREAIRLWEARHMGAGKAKRTAALSGFKVERPGATHRELEFLGGRKMSREEIGATIGAMPIVMGIVENANRANSETQEIIHWTLNVMPLAYRIASVLTTELAWRYDANAELWFDFRKVPILQKRNLESVKAARELFSMGVPRNVLNDLLDWGVPDDQAGAVAWLPFNIAPADQLLGEAPAETPEGEPIDEEEEPPGGSENLAAGLARRATAEGPDRNRDATRATPTEVQRDRLAKQFRESCRPVERQATRTLQGYFRQQREGVLERLAKFELNEAGSYQRKGAGSCILTRDLVAEVIFELAAQRERMRVVSYTFLRTAVQLGAAQAATEAAKLTGEGAEAVTVEDPLVAEKLAVQQNRIKDLPIRTWQKLRGELIEGTNGGETISQLASRVRGLYQKEIGDMTAGRALRIARTEVPSAVNASRTAGFKRAGVNGKSWLTARAGDVRGTHVAAERDTIGDPIPADDRFRVGNSLLDYPGDPSGPAGEVINCRCTVLAAMLKNAGASIELYFGRDFGFNRGPRRQKTVRDNKETTDGQEQKIEQAA